MQTQPQDAAQWHQARRRRRRRGCAALILTPVLVIVTLLAWFGLRLADSPKVSRNFVAEMNAQIEAVPEEDRAWPLYKQAVLFKIEHPMTEALMMNRPIYPGWAQWDENKAWLEEVAPALALVREGARKPRLAKPMTDVQDEDIARAYAAADGWTYEKETPSDNPMLIGVLLPELGYMRNFAQDLTSDSFFAMESGDRERAIEDIEAMLGLAKHSAASTTLIGQLVQVAIEHLAALNALRLIDAYPGAFSADELARIQQAFMTMGRDGMPDQGRMAPITLDITLERAMFEDIVQRTYSDDGHGDGHMTLEGAKMLPMLSSMSLQGDGLVEALPSVLLAASRKDLMDKYNGYMDGFEQYAATNPWDRDNTWNLDAEVEQIHANVVTRARYALLSILLPALGRAVVVMDQANTRRDATIAAIGLHRYRAEHGSWPASLEAMVPEFLPRLPKDMVDGEPLRYLLTAEGPVLYSLGADADDDGGKRGEDGRKVMAGQSDGVDGDWVLYPPLPAEEPVDD